MYRIVPVAVGLTNLVYACLKAEYTDWGSVIRLPLQVNEYMSRVLTHKLH